MKEYVFKLEKELAATRAQLQAQNDMQKAMGGALVAVLEKNFRILLTAELVDVFDEGSLAVAVAGFNPHLMLMLMEFVIVGV
nr:uncharacterized protein LOC109149981 [Ipomoea batatas]